MSERTFNMRLSCVYDGDNNTIERLEVEHQVEGQWQPLDLNTLSPGFDIFVYAVFTCQHMYFRVNCAERGLTLSRAEGSITLGTDADWSMDTLKVHFSAQLRAGQASREDIDYIVARMKQCPVSCNIPDLPGAESSITLG